MKASTSIIQGIFAKIIKHVCLNTSSMLTALQMHNVWNS